MNSGEYSFFPGISVSENGHLLYDGIDTQILAETYGTPLYVYSEARLRNRCRTYKEAMKKAFGDKGRVLYASKAASFKRIYEIIGEEGLETDVVSCGEIITAQKAGFDLSKAYFHSNNKTDEDIRFAMEHGVGYFVVDNADELFAVNAIAAEKNRKQKILLRITPGIDPHTYDAVSTGKVDSKFGNAIETGTALAVTGQTLQCGSVTLEGFHCHVGSQIFDSSVYLKVTDVMLRFCRTVFDTFGYTAKILDIGGGYGVRYIASQPEIDIAACIGEVGAFIHDTCEKLDIPMPVIAMEPGRSICADAGMTLYTVGSVKRIPGYKNYVSVDGGMTDNIRFALYGAPYCVFPAGAMQADCDMPCDVVGRCCESGDILQKDVLLPCTIKRGDLLAVPVTGAYHYSMASNYNMLGKPAIVMLADGSHRLAVKRQSPFQISENDI